MDEWTNAFGALDEANAIGFGMSDLDDSFNSLQSKESHRFQTGGKFTVCFNSSSCS